MNSFNVSPGHGPGSNWQTLGELTLARSSADHDLIRAWLTKRLATLSLNPEFLKQISNSARDAAARILNPDPRQAHIHLMIFVSLDRISTGQTWGFFRVEKINYPSGADPSESHSVGFYLYAEGQQV